MNRWEICKFKVKQDGKFGNLMWDNVLALTFWSMPVIISRHLCNIAVFTVFFCLNTNLLLPIFLLLFLPSNECHLSMVGVCVLGSKLKASGHYSLGCINGICQISGNISNLFFSVGSLKWHHYVLACIVILRRVYISNIIFVGKYCWCLRLLQCWESMNSKSNKEKWTAKRQLCVSLHMKLLVLEKKISFP